MRPCPAADHPRFFARAARRWRWASGWVAGWAVLAGLALLAPQLPAQAVPPAQTKSLSFHFVGPVRG
ncbi:MAG: hypothetical protein ACRD2F_14485, partial [Terriglobales bacterium]